MEDKNNSLTEKFEAEIYEKTLDLKTDYAELAIDSLTDNALIKEIPIIKTLAAFYNISSSMLARYSVKKVLAFLQELHAKNIASDKVAKFKEYFEKNPKHRYTVLETVLALIERISDIEKAKILANLFRAHMEENISWNEFRHIAFVLDSLNPMGYEFLHQMSREKNWATHSENTEGEAFMFACGIGHRYGTRFMITKTGKKLYEYGIKPLSN